MTTPRALTAEELGPVCDPRQFSFASTADLPDLAGMIGQQRALRFGMGLPSAGYTILVLGPANTAMYRPSAV